MTRGRCPTRTAFVLSGGGSLGAVQVGMLQALAAQGVVPDLLVGTSAGAMNAAWVATHGTTSDSLAGLAETWARTRRQDVFPLDLRAAVRGVLGRSPAVVSTDRLRALVTAHVGAGTHEDALVPVHLVTADLLSGEAVTLSTGPLVAGVLASAAIPGILPPVLHRGRYLVDGGIAATSGVAVAVELGATLVYLLPAGAPCARPEPPSTAVGNALHALTLLIQQRLARSVAALAGAATIKVLPPLCPLRISAADFRHGAQLVERARVASTHWITNGDIDLPSPHRFLAAHTHRGPSDDGVLREEGGTPCLER